MHVDAENIIGKASFDIALEKDINYEYSVLGNSENNCVGLSPRATNEWCMYVEAGRGMCDCFFWYFRVHVHFNAAKYSSMLPRR